MSADSVAVDDDTPMEDVAEHDVNIMENEISKTEQPVPETENNKKKTPSEKNTNTGGISLPLSRVKRIIKLDEDVRACSNPAAFAIAVATEMFIKHICEQGAQISKNDKRKTLLYKDLANAVDRSDELEFLTDVIPRTMPLSKALKERKALLQSQQTQHINIMESEQ
ncbi:histone-fold-containing protein [Dipodascopsis uninucleata]